MADINISVDTSTQLYTITLDKWEWTNLYIWENNQWVNVSRYSGPSNNIQFQYTQPSAGHLKFKAVANENVVLVNGPNMMFLEGPANATTYMAAISYSNTGAEIHLQGVLETFDENMNGQPGPILFSQGRMTGTFQSSN